MTPEEDAALGPHSDYVGELCAQGRVVLAGAVPEPAGGVVFFFADNRDEAEAILNKEPLVQAGMGFGVWPSTGGKATSVPHGRS